MTNNERFQLDQLQHDAQAIARRLAEAEAKLEACFQLAERSGASVALLPAMTGQGARVSTKALEFIRGNEGCRRSVYMDGGGFLHIGYGVRIGPSIAGATLQTGESVSSVLDGAKGSWISEPQARFLLYCEALAAVNRIIMDFGNVWWDEIADTDKGVAVLDVYYTLGSLAAFPAAKRALLDKRWEAAALNLLFVDPDAGVRIKTAYYNQVGDRATKVCVMLTS